MDYTKSDEAFFDRLNSLSGYLNVGVNDTPPSSMKTQLVDDILNGVSKPLEAYGVKPRKKRIFYGYQNMTGFRGVRVRSDRYDTPFEAYLFVSKERQHIGYYESAYEAAIAYDEAAKVAYGKRAVLNFSDRDGL